MKKIYIFPLIVGVFLGGIGVWYSKSYIQNFVFFHNISSIHDSQEGQKYIANIHEIYRLLQKGYFDKEKISLSGMREGSVKGFVSALNDPYTEYFTTQENTNFASALKGEEDFEGIGAGVAKKEGGIQIQEVYKGTPAALVGLQPLDMVLAISGTKTDNLTLQQAVDMIRGPKGTTVKLLIYRASRKENGKNGIFTVEPTRQRVEIPSVQGSTIPLVHSKGNVCYIAISVIGDTTDSALLKELLACKKNNPVGYVVDLRGNGGGYLQKGVDIASHFLSKDMLVVSSKYMTFPSETYTTSEDGQYKDKPIVVLIDSLTASAGEIIAGALKQNAHAKLVGSTTFGKGSIQTVVEIGSGAGLKYTIGKRYLPDNTNIDKIGLKPDIEIEFDTEGYKKNMFDNQKERAISVLEDMIQ